MMKMTMMTGLLICVAITGMAVAEEPIGIDVSLDFNSKYVWRGQNLVDDWVFQPGVSLTYDSFTFGIWGNSDMTGAAADLAGARNEDFEFTEWDYYADYSGTVPDMEWLGYSIGVINYQFPGGAADTTEVYVGLSVDTVLSPSVTAYFDVDEAEGTYISFGVSHSVDEIASIDENTPIGMDMSLSIGWGDSNYNEFYWTSPAVVDSSGLNDLTLQFAFPIPVGSWTITPSLNYVTLLSDDIRNNSAGYSEDNDFFYAGVGIATSF